MAFLSSEEFTDLLVTESLDGLVTEHVFDGSVYVFRRAPGDYDLLRGHLSAELGGIATNNIRVVGSAKVGFSLSPAAFPRAFSSRSDIDVLVVDRTTFDRIWLSILGWHYPQPENLGLAAQWSRKRRYDVYWGCIHPTTILSIEVASAASLRTLKEISGKWFAAFQGLSKIPAFADRKISGRLYRTWDHALLYQIESLRQIRESLHRD